MKATSHNRTVPALKIRAHHLLCMQGFQGLGYSPGFVQNFENVLKQIHNNFYETELEVTDDIDSLCAPCPHHQNGFCQKDPQAQERMQKMDRVVLQKLEIQNGSHRPAESLFALANTRLLTKTDVKDICGHCEWREKCLWYRRLKPTASP